MEGKAGPVTLAGRCHASPGAATWATWSRVKFGTAYPKPGRLVGLFTEGHPELANGSEALRTDGVTLEEVGKALGVTRERARQLEMQALRKCRRWCERNGYKFEDLAASWPQPERVRRDWRDY